MIRLDIRPYCHSCLDFEADVEKAEILYAHNEELAISDTIIQCKHRERCETIKRYLMHNLSIIEQFKEGNNG